MKLIYQDMGVLTSVKEFWSKYPVIKEHLVSAGHTFAAAFVLAIIVQLKQADFSSTAVTFDAALAISIALVRIGTKAGIQALWSIFIAYFENQAEA